MHHPLAMSSQHQRSTITNMSDHRWHWLAIGLVATGVVAVVIAAVANAQALGWWQVLLYAGCAAALGAALLFRRKLSAKEVELEVLRHRLSEEEGRIAAERSQFEELRLAMQD